MDLNNNTDMKLDSQNPQQQQKSKIIKISQPTKILMIPHDQPFTDDYLDSILPSKGYKIVNPPPKRSMTTQNIENVSETLSGIDYPSIFSSLIEDTRDESELTPAESMERFSAKLLTDIREGTVYQRKQAMRIYLNLTPKFGQDLIFKYLLPLINLPTLNDHERHIFVKLIDRLIFRINGLKTEYINAILSFAEPMLINSENIIRSEGRELVSNLTKYVGFATIINCCKPYLAKDAEIDEEKAATISRVIAIAGITHDISKTISLVSALLKSKNDQHTVIALKIIYSTAQFGKIKILPFLPKYVRLIDDLDEDKKDSFFRLIIEAIKILADSITPKGGDELKPLIIFVKNAMNNNKNMAFPAFASLIACMRREDAAVSLFELYEKKHLRNAFETQNEKIQLAALTALQNAINLEALSDNTSRNYYGNIRDLFFSSMWNVTNSLKPKLHNFMLSITFFFAQRSGVQLILEIIFFYRNTSSTSKERKDLVDKFRTSPVDYRVLVCREMLKISESLSFDRISGSFIRYVFERIIELYFEINNNSTSGKKKNDPLKIVRAMIRKLVESCKYSLRNCVGIINGYIERKNSSSYIMRERAISLIELCAPIFGALEEESTLKAHYANLQESFSEGYSSVLAASLRALDAIANQINVDKLPIDPNDVIARLIPVLKNSNEKVQYACVKFTQTIASSTSKTINPQEWLRICYELIELLRSDQSKIRNITTKAFADIAKATSPYDVLLTLLNNFRVQDRQNRKCTTIAISTLAKSCGPYNVIPALLNEYRTPDYNVQNATIKSLQSLFQVIGRDCANYCYSVTPLLTFALIERDINHRQHACSAVTSFVLGLFGQGKEDAIIHLLNHVIPNIFENTLTFTKIFMETMNAIRASLGPGVVLQYVLSGLFHPAKKVRSQYWRIYNNLIIYSGDELVPYYPKLEKKEGNNYNRDELEVFI